MPLQGGAPALAACSGGKANSGVQESTDECINEELRDLTCNLLWCAQKIADLFMTRRFPTLVLPSCFFVVKKSRTDKAVDEQVKKFLLDSCKVDADKVGSQSRTATAVGLVCCILPILPSTLTILVYLLWKSCVRTRERCFTHTTALAIIGRRDLIYGGHVRHVPRRPLFASVGKERRTQCSTHFALTIACAIRDQSTWFVSTSAIGLNV